MTLIEPQRALLVSFLGAGLSFTAGFVVLLYGGYANYNWQIADEIAADRGWKDLVYSHPLSRASKGYVNRMALRLAPRDHIEEQAPIFWLFFIGSGILFILHTAFGVWALVSLYQLTTE